MKETKFTEVMTGSDDLVYFKLHLFASNKLRGVNINKLLNAVDAQLSSGLKMLFVVGTPHYRNPQLHVDPDDVHLLVVARDGDMLGVATKFNKFGLNLEEVKNEPNIRLTPKYTYKPHTGEIKIISFNLEYI